MQHTVITSNKKIPTIYNIEAEKIPAILLEVLNNINIMNSLSNSVNIKLERSKYLSNKYQENMDSIIIKYEISDKLGVIKLIHVFRKALDYSYRVKINNELESKLIKLMLGEIEYNLENITNNKYSSIKAENYKKSINNFLDNLVKFCNEENN